MDPATDCRPWTYLEKGYYPATPLMQEIDHAASNCFHQDSKPVDRNSEPLVVVFGVGYVGFHLIRSFSTQYNVLGFDVSEKRIQEVASQFHTSDRVRFTTSVQDISKATHLLISVPTLLHPDKSIDSSNLRSALHMTGMHARAGATVVVESSVAVGMTRQLLGPLAATRRFFAAYRSRPDRTAYEIYSQGNFWFG